MRLGVQLVPLQQRPVMLQGVLEVPGAMVIQARARDRWPRWSLAAEPARRTPRASRARERAGAAPAAGGLRWRDWCALGWKLRARRLRFGHPRTWHGCRRLTRRAGRGRLRGGNRGRGERRGRRRRGARLPLSWGPCRADSAPWDSREQPSAPRARACGTTGCKPASRSSPGRRTAARIRIRTIADRARTWRGDGRVAERREDGVPLRRARRPRRRLRRAPTPERIKELAHCVMRRASA